MRSKEQKRFISTCEHFGGRLYKVGKNPYKFKCLCPSHKEKTPSFYFDKSSLLFHCFGCGIGGNGIKDLLSEMQIIQKPCKECKKPYKIKVSYLSASGLKGEFKLYNLKYSKMIASKLADLNAHDIQINEIVIAPLS